MCVNLRKSHECQLENKVVCVNLRKSRVRQLNKLRLSRAPRELRACRNEMCDNPRPTGAPRKKVSLPLDRHRALGIGLL
jgi:hypothetical protein